MIPIFRPHLPKFADTLPLLNTCEQRCIYSNNGPLLQEFEANLAHHFNVAENSLCTISSGTLALVAAIKAMHLPKNAVCLMPAWTFTATPAAAIMAGIEIIFCDVDDQSMMLTPSIALDAIEQTNKNIDLVIAVSAFGAPINALEWDQFTNATGITVLIDGAASFDQATIGFTPTMLSFHATKIFGIGEGGVLISANQEFIKNAKQYANFGFIPGNRISETAGINARLNEISAAIGITALEHWESTRAQYQQIWNLYTENLITSKYYNVQEGFGDLWLSTNLNLILNRPIRNQLSRYLEKCGIENRSWWGNGCHKMPAYQHITCLDLYNTDQLASRVIALPFHTKLEEAQIKIICNALTQFFDRQNEIIASPIPEIRDYMPFENMIQAHS
jgi:dTDP-4-amino-4,6-dideoxygalactose transaminase